MEKIIPYKIKQKNEKELFLKNINILVKKGFSRPEITHLLGCKKGIIDGALRLGIKFSMSLKNLENLNKRFTEIFDKI